MIRPLAILGLALLPACLSVGPSEVVNIVDYEIRVPAAKWTGARLRQVMAVRPFAASQDLEREGVRYRTSDVEGGYWADHRWAEPVPTMVRSAVEEYFEASGQFAEVILLDNLGNADLLLAGEIHRFDEEDRPEGWFGVAEITFEVVEGGREVYHRRFRVEEPCEDTTVREVVRALGRALGKILGELSRDLGSRFAGD